MTGSIHNLAETDDGSAEVGYDICIVGAGAAGAYLYKRLTQLGLKAICLEAGGLKGEPPEKTGFVPGFTRSEYPGALVGRSFGLGGSTCRWGGLLAPHSEHDRLAAGDSPERPTWSHIVDTVEKYQDTVLRHLGFEKSPEFFAFAERRLGNDASTLRDAGIGVISSIFLPFRKKNLARLVGSSANEAASKVYIHAVAKSWHLDAGGTIAELTAISPNGRKLKVEAKHFVVASGAIESARILKEIERESDKAQLSADTGRYLGDHLSIGIADVATSSLARVTSDYAPRFAGPWMRSFRFVETEAASGVPRSFSHFVFENESPGFKLAKNVLTSLQARRFPRLSIAEVVSGVKGVTQLGFNRFAANKLHIPRTTTTRLQLDIEQTPSTENLIELDDEQDQYGRPRAKVSWEISDIDMENLHAAADRLMQKWQGCGADLPELELRDLQKDSSKPHDAYHPVGVCRMGTDSDAVVDLDYAVNGLRNASVISTAILPSAGTANPTFTMLCLAERFAARVSGENQ